MELSVRAGPRQGIFHFPEATASVLVKELSLGYYDMFAVVSCSFKTVRRGWGLVGHWRDWPQLGVGPVCP